MKKKSLIILLLIGSILSIYKIVTFVVTDKIDSYLKKKDINNRSISINLLLGNITLNAVSVAKDSILFTCEKLELDGVSYYQYLTNNAINIADLKVVNSKITGKIVNKRPEKKEKTTTLKNIESGLKIKNIQFKNLEIDIKKKDNFPLKVKNTSFIISDFSLDVPPNKSIPFLYSNIELSIMGFETQYSKVQKVKFSKLVLEKENLSIDSVEIVPLKSRETYIYHVHQQKELLTLFSKKIVISDFKIEEKEKLNFRVNQLLLNEVFFNLYLDGTVLEHPNKRKDLYSKSLRNLPFNIDIKHVDIKNSTIIYEEYTIKENKPGILVFNNLNAQINNINNNSVRDNNITEAKIQSNFMKYAPLDIKWTFDINNKNDEFRITGSLFNVNSKNMSSFLLPTTNVKMNGFIDKMYFDFEGNDFTSNGKLNLDFKKFNIQVLDKDKSKKKIISWLANLFIKDSSKNGIVKVATENVERDTTKSFWNFFWKNIEKGLQNSLI